MSCYLMTYDEKMSEKLIENLPCSAQLEMKCLLNDYRLMFCKNGNKAVLSIEKREGAETPVVIWKTDTADVNIFEKIYPKDRYERKVFLLKAEGITLPVFGYLAKSRKAGLPDGDYLEMTAAAYEEHDFDFKYIEEAADFAADHVNGKTDKEQGGEV